MKNKRLVDGVTCFVSVLVLLTGCVSPYPQESDFQSVVRGGKSVVLIGFRTHWNGTPSEPVKEFASMASSPMQLAVSSFDKAERLEKQRAFSLGEPDASGRQWTCLFLSPGSYYLWAVPPTWLERDVNFPLEQAGGFWLQVVPGQPVQYAGTLQYDLGGSKFIQEKFYKRFACSVLDERQDAAGIAQTELARFGGTMGVSVMCPYGQAALYSNSVFPALVMTQSPDIIRSPDWKARAKDRAWGPVEFMVSDSSGQAAIGAVGIAIVYYPIGWYLSSSWAAEDIEKWQPCVAAINKHIEQILPDRRLRQQLADTMGSDAVIVEVNQTAIEDRTSLVSENHCGSLLLADIQRIQLRECYNKTYCVEVATRIRLWDRQTGRYVFDWTLLYTNPKALFFDQIDTQYPWILEPPTPMPNEIVLGAVSPNCPMDDYCGAAGIDLFTQELDNAISQTVMYAVERIVSP
ncbi:MAG: hypothetical protein ISS71_00390 [Phycisphaerae bacterium]|nr:hypothetical protein [Phycisphaerae bacterium]